LSRPVLQNSRKLFFSGAGRGFGLRGLERRATPLLPENLRASFVTIVKRAFSQRRKMMLKLLREDWPAEKLERAFAELKIPLQERAEKLSLEQFVALTGKLLS
jgi:16S rRNA A1518/A1519 N6-dimethyltransferase RsmA/KsgA/DIM1 with predicted DNA glycosylase/AP lyase activity